MTDAQNTETAGIVAALLSLRLKAAPFVDVGVAIGDDQRTVHLQALDDHHEWHFASVRLDRPVAEGDVNLLYGLLECGKA